MASNHRTCFVYDKEQSTKILIQLIYEIPYTTIHRQFNLLRSADEILSQTIHRLITNIERITMKENRSSRQQSNNVVLHSEKRNISVQLFDINNQLINDNQANREAWSNCRKLVIDNQYYNVEYNAPSNDNDYLIELIVFAFVSHH